MTLVSTAYRDKDIDCKRANRGGLTRIKRYQKDSKGFVKFDEAYHKGSSLPILGIPARFLNFGKMDFLYAQ